MTPASPIQASDAGHGGKRLRFGATTALLTTAFLLLQPATSSSADMAEVTMGTAGNFSVLAGSTVTNTGFTIVSGEEADGGNLGVSPGSAVTGFPPGAVLPPGTIHVTDGQANNAQADLVTAYNDAAGRACNDNRTDEDLGGLTLTTGVYCYDTSAQLTGTLTLDAEDVPDSIFIFQIGSTLTTASNSTVSLINGAQACRVFWQVGSSATIGTNTDFVGTVMALTSITANTDADVEGRLLARNGAVTLDDNTINDSSCAVETGIPLAPLLGSAGSAIAIAGIFAASAVLVLRRRSRLAHV